MRNTSKRIIALLLAVVMIIGILPTVFAAGEFTDVKGNDWFASFVAYAAEKGLMNGMSETTFEPNTTSTRAMAATVLYRIEGSPEVEEEASFTDLAADWYKASVAWAEDAGVVNGVGNGKFAPDALVSREQLLTMIWRYAGSPKAENAEGLAEFPDAANVSDYAKDAFNWGIEKGIINGKDGKLDPAGDATRAEFAKIISVFDQQNAEVEATEAVIFYTNDVHTYVDKALSYNTVAALKAEAIAAGYDALLVDAGDHAQGTAYGSMDKGETIIALMNAAGYDYATLGNHEFDYGMDGAMNIIEKAEYEYLSANFYNEKDGVRGENVLDAYTIVELAGKKVALVGITTPESFTKSTPAYFQDENGNYIYGIAGGVDGAALYADVQAAIDAAKAEGAEIVIALGHLGDDPASDPWNSEDVISNTTGLTAFIDGHSHSTVEGKEVADKEGKPVILTQTGEYFGAIGKMMIKADGTITTELITESEASDETVKASVEAWKTEVDALLGEVVAKNEVDFRISDDDGNRLIRKQETNLGDFAADALFYLFKNMDMDVDVAIMNGGGIRANMPVGDVSYKTTKTVHTFGNVACLQTITGQQLLDALEWGARNVGAGENGGFLHVSGITFEIHANIPSTVQMDDKGVWTGAPTGEYRVKNVMVAGEPLDLAANYNLAGYNYTLRDLGDGFAMFDGAVNVLDYVMEDYLVLANYAKSFPEATIKADNSVLGANYGDINGEGRVTIVDPDDPTDIIIYYTNDVHTYIDKELSYNTVAALKAESIANGNDTLLVDAGDHAQGTAYGSMDKGEHIVALMNAAGYDYATLGNHEFDYGMDGAMNIIDKAEYEYLSANFYNEKDGVRGDNVLKAYTIVEMEGKKVALVGITTPESFTKSTPAYFQDENGNYIYGIAGGTDGAELYADVQAAIDAAKAEGAEIIIALGHLGDDPASDPWNSEDVISNVTGLDAFIDGHSHSTVERKEVADKEGNIVVLTQTGEYFGAIGKMAIKADGTIETELITKSEASNEEVKAAVDAWMTEVDGLLEEVVAKNEIDFRINVVTGQDEEGKDIVERLIRKQETNLGDFAADALYYLFDNMDMDVDVAIMNGGGIRANMPVGDVSYKTTKTVHTFGNVACLQTITGQQLLDALEWGAKNVGVGENGGFLHVSGITYEIHSYIESTVQADDKGVWVGAPTGEYRVKNVMVGGVPLDLTATYNLAGYNYTLRDLGDGFAMFDGAVNVLDYVMEDYLVLANYAKSFPEATIKADNSVLGANYADINGEGRIEIIAEDPNPAPVPAEGFVLAETIKAGDEVIIVCAAKNIAFSAEKFEGAGGFYNAGVEVTPVDGKITDAPAALVWTVGEKDGGLTLNYDGKAIGMADQYSSTNLGEKHDVWVLEAALTEGAHYLKNVGREVYLEWYEGKTYWSGYYNNSVEELFALNFYVKAG